MPSMPEYVTQTTGQRLDRLARAADELALAIRGASAAALARRPDARSWAATEVLCHLRDTEESFMARVETMMAMDGPIFGAINPDRWAEERQYLRCDAGEALAAFRRRRQETLGFFRTLGSDQWQRGGVYRGGEADRPGREAGRPGGAHVTADNVLTMIARHDDDHLDQLRQALAAVSGGRPAPPLR